MKIRHLFSFIAIIFLMIILSACVHDVVIDNNDYNASFVSNRSIGCISNATLEKTENTSPQIRLSYLGDGKLKTNILFNTLCSAEMMDSVSLHNNIIDIYMADTCKSGAKCTCVFMEEYNFLVTEGSEYRLVFNLKPWTINKYSFLADTLIKIE